ncbi:hypothetical protein GGR53DRAFT_128815 [Hypoxylon sp. FL1150]|nr:hypothetical protein GGR53DRAFT_128815 [Hypoxylon sp. FL1150]
MGYSKQSRQESKLQEATKQDEQERSVPKSQWSALLNLLKEQIAQAAKLARDNKTVMSLEEHNAYYRAVFGRVREEVASRKDIPNAVMDPPTQMLTMTFYGGWHEVCCIGCLDYYPTNDIIHVELQAKKGEPDGVTKDDLLECICEVLHGGIHMDNRNSKEIGITLTDLNWLGTTRICNLVDNILYVGYMPASEGQEESGKQVSRQHNIVWEGGALGAGVSSVQGFNDDYCRRLTKTKGWKEEDWDLLGGFF